MGCRDRKDCIIEIGDLVVIVYPEMDWDWSRYKIGDLGMVMNISCYNDYSVIRVKLFRTGKIEPMPCNYVNILGDKNGSGRSDSIK